MLLVHAKCIHPGAADDYVQLDYRVRQKSRFRTFTVSGCELAVQLPRGTVLNDGDNLRAIDGTTIRVVATAERLSRVDCPNGAELARAAYHLGNRHVALEVGAGFVAYQADHVLDAMLQQLGFRVGAVVMPFEPEPGAYQHHVWDAPDIEYSRATAERQS